MQVCGMIRESLDRERSTHQHMELSLSRAECSFLIWIATRARTPFAELEMSLCEMEVDATYPCRDPY